MSPKIQRSMLGLLGTSTFETISGLCGPYSSQQLHDVGSLSSPIGFPSNCKIACQRIYSRPLTTNCTSTLLTFQANSYNQICTTTLRGLLWTHSPPSRVLSLIRTLPLRTIRRITLKELPFLLERHETHYQCSCKISSFELFKIHFFDSNIVPIHQLLTQ